MDKTVLKKFAIESRKDLMEKIKNKINTFYVEEEFKKEQKGELYILSNEKHSLSLTNEEYQKRELLIKRIKELSIEQVIEEAAYTWFNRIIAIRYMEIHDYLPLTKDNQSLGIRVLSSKDNTPDPEILKFTNLTNPDLDIDFKKEKYLELKSDNEKFKYILLLVCRKLGRVIPQVFDGVTDYIDILIPDNLLNDTGFVTKVIKEVPEENYSNVEIIGWLYQYYNQTEKDRVMAKNKTYEKNEIPYVTQLFTPDWIVKYMVQNSLGKYYIENTKDTSVCNCWKFYIETEKKKKDEKFSIENTSFIDPCCGSGHILVYAFEVFYQIYFKAGFNKRDIPELILKNNLYGLDIDDRSGQLSILSILLKAREYDKNIFNKKVVKDLMICSIQETNNLNDYLLHYFNDEKINNDIRYLKETFKDAKEIGSLIIVENKDYSDLKAAITNDDSIIGIELRAKILPLIKQAEILSKKHKIMVTNPPYMNSGVMTPNLKKYVLRNYAYYKTDLCTAFMNVRFLADNAKMAMINQHSWMFLSSFEQMRNEIINTKSISTMIHLGTKAFEEIGGEVVQTTTFVMENEKNLIGKFMDLTEVKDSTKKPIEARNKIIANDFRNAYLTMFNKMPGKVFAYWASDRVLEIFENNKPIMEYVDARQGMATGDNNKFVRFWYEVNREEIKFDCKTIEEFSDSKKRYVPYIKSSGICRWYGNYFNVLKFDDENRKILANSGNHLPSKQYYFKNNFNWSLISTDKFGARISEHGGIFDVGAHAVFSNNEKILKKIGAFLNSNVFNYLIKFIGLTLNYNSGIVQLIPFIEPDDKVIQLVNDNIFISKYIWDSFETSWDFTKHPLIKEMTGQYIKSSNEKPNFYLYTVFDNWKHETEIRFNKLKENEEELNKIFIDIYGLKDELTPEVEDKNITVRKADKLRDIKSLISYAVGCMFGRYSLDKEGLIYAGGDFDEVYKKYKTEDGGYAGASQANYTILNDNGKEINLSFEVDNDNVIPIIDEAYFKDDIVKRFKKFISVVYGKETLNENLDFIAETLGKKGTETSEDTIRRYFVNDFFNDHVKTYQKRPIYWLFDSGKKNGFKALIYMHRYNENLVPKIRIDYLHIMQNTYEKLLSEVNYRLTMDLSMADKKEAQKRQADLNAKLQEIREYDEKMAHIANQKIKIDLDDGVKVNYGKFQDILAKIK